LDEVVLRSLEHEPDRRYQHASEVKTEVESISLRPAGDERMTSVPVAVGPSGGEGAAKSLGRQSEGSGPDPVGKWFRRKILAVSLGLYALSFILPAYRMYASWDNGPGDRGHLEMQLLYGWECFRTAWDTSKDVWYANPVFWVACGLLALRRWLWAGLVAGVA